MKACESRYLPEVQFRGHAEHRSSHDALYATAAMRGGVEPDHLNDAGWWQTGFWTYAVCALVIYARAAAAWNDTTAGQIAQNIAACHQLTADLAASGSHADSEVRHLLR